MNSRSIWADNICHEEGWYSSISVPGQGTITEVVVSEGIEEIGDNAFNSSVVLEKLDLPTTLKKMGEWIIFHCPQLKELNIPYGITTIGESALQGHGYIDSLTTIIIPDSVTTIERWAFSYRRGLKNLKIPASVTNIGENAFRGCENIENIDIDENNKNYKSIDGMMYSKDGTTLIKGVNKANVVIADGTKIVEDGAFDGYKALANITIPNSVTSIGNRAFYECTSLSGITIPNSVTKIESSAFSNCEALTSITIPSSVKTMGVMVFAGDTITVNVFFKENEKPEGWDENWKEGYSYPPSKITVNYAK